MWSRSWPGCGEVDASGGVRGGVASARETSLAGFCWVLQRAADATALVEQIVVARVPALLPAHREENRTGAAKPHAAR